MVKDLKRYFSFSQLSVMLEVRQRKSQMDSQRNQEQDFLLIFCIFFSKVTISHLIYKASRMCYKLFQILDQISALIQEEIDVFFFQHIDSLQFFDKSLSESEVCLNKHELSKLRGLWVNDFCMKSFSLFTHLSLDPKDNTKVTTA